MKISVIVPVYNEEKVIGHCLESLAKQTIYKNLEIIVVDDGSTDNTVSKVRNAILLKQDHLGPGSARNLGAVKAKGKILVFVDADMEFAPDFIEKLTGPIILGKTIGTFSKEEYLLNKDNIWARLWNQNLGRQAEKMHPDNYPDTQAVFRAILKSKFDAVGGFDSTTGYTDDWSLSEKLGIMAMAVPGAKYFHRNPETFSEIWRQARWFGKNEFLTGNHIRQTYNLLRYFPIFSLAKGVFGVIKFGEPGFIFFKVIFDTAVFISVFNSFSKENKTK